MVCLLGIAVTFDVTETEAAANNTVTGSVYHDINGNGVQDLSKLEVGLAQQKVDLYQNLTDAQNNENILRTVTTNSLGIFSFTKLEKGSYYLRYDQNEGYTPTISENSVRDAYDQPISGIVQVNVDKKLQLIYTTKLSLRRATSLNILPFGDINWDGVMNADEEIVNGKTMIILDLRRLSNVLKSGELASIDLSSLLLNAVSGNVDIANAIYLRTTKNGEIINMPDVESGFYVMIRSPFNLTLSGMLENTAKISAILDIIQGKDITGILDHPELVSTGDIDTNSDNRYIKLLAQLLPQIANEFDKIDYASLLGEENAATIYESTEKLRKLGHLIDQLPATRFVKVNYFGHAYDLTGLQFKKTNQFFFGIKEYAAITGQVFTDTNLDGKKGTLEFLKAVTVTAYDTTGNILAQTTSPGLLGEYKLDKLPYGQPIYLGVSESAPVYPEVVDGKPQALADKKIVAVYEFGRTDSVTTISQNIGIASLSDITVSVKARDEVKNTATLTFSNKNSAAVTVNYEVNNEAAGSFGIKAKGLFAKEAVYNLPLDSLKPSGENQLKANWTVGIYQGSLELLDF